MLAIASQIILCLVLAALIGLIIGYLLGKANCPKDTYKAVTPIDSHTEDDGDCGDKTDDKTDGTASEEDYDTYTAAAQNSAEEEASAEPQGLLSNNQTVADSDDDTSASAASSTDESEEEDIPSDDDKPTGLLDAPRGGKKDNLTRIKGIGLKIDATLNSIGVYHFDQIAAWTEKEAKWIDHYLSFPGRSLRDDWVGQAKLLAEGKETEFSKRVDAGEVATSKKD